jgi:hypothetical protein
MIDPITAIAVATKAFNTVKAMVAAGRDVEDTLGQIGAWYGACSDFNEAKKQAENPPLFKRLVARQSVEQEAMEIYAKEKKIKQQEKELRELLMYSYGPQVIASLLHLEEISKINVKKLFTCNSAREKLCFGIAFKLQVYLFWLIVVTLSFY